MKIQVKLAETGLKAVCEFDEKEFEALKELVRIAMGELGTAHDYETAEKISSQLDKVSFKPR